MRTLYIRKTITEKWSIPTQLLIFRQPKALESLNWYQMIAMTMFLNSVIRPKKKIIRAVAGQRARLLLTFVKHKAKPDQ